ncbi:Putative hydroxyacylglutathione hydrolase GloB [gamma proteobacterium HdN1]|nr:Putative hydroxyacylglutathione hydrolase GloB [gamma proteobacterium HdN1]
MISKPNQAKSQQTHETPALSAPNQAKPLSSFQIKALPAFQDNYVWLLHNTQSAVVVDPGDAGPVLSALNASALSLSEIWITHHHADHIGGVAELQTAFPSVIIRTPAASTLPGNAISQQDGDEFSLFGQHTVQVWHLPGHTIDHIVYLLKAAGEPIHLFCGDTLFGAGCGRLFGGTANQLYTSLQRISQLPSDTKIYCAHEYTQSNLRFAQAVEPENGALQSRIQTVTAQRARGEKTVPLSLAEELATNPFLRISVPTVTTSILKHFIISVTQPTELFAFLRKWKDAF